MKIAIIGAGRIGTTLGAKWEAAGHAVVYGVRSPDGKAEQPVLEAADGADVIVLAVPGAAAMDVIESLGQALAGRFLIDATNDVGSPGSGTVRARAAIAEGAIPVRAFNTLGWENFADPVVGGVRADLLFGADEGPGKDVAEQLIRDVGLEPVWLGGIDEFDVVDSVTQLWFTLVFKRGLGRRLAFKLLRDQPG